MNSSREPTKRKPNPYVKANFFSKWFYCWTYELFRKGMQVDGLEAGDIYEHVSYLDSAKLCDSLDDYWAAEVRGSARGRQPSLMRMIFRAHGWRFVPISLLYSILEIAIHVAQPLFLGNFVMYFTDGQTSMSLDDAFLNAGGIALCALLLTLCFHPYMRHLFEVGTRVRLGCAGLVYRKCLRSALTSDNSGISGYAIAVLSTDLPQFDVTFYFFYDLWKGPVEAILFGCVMYREVGWPGLVGVAAIALFIPLQVWAAKAAIHYKERSSEQADERVKLMNELIGAIQVVKMYAWERSFARLVAAVRGREMRAIRGSMNIYAALQCTNMISKLALFLTLLSYAFTGEVVTARKVFVVSSYFNLLNDSLLNFWPLAINTWAETSVCAHRIQKFLLQSEVPTAALGPETGVHNFGLSLAGETEKDNVDGSFEGRRHDPHGSEKGVRLRNFSASWDHVDLEHMRTAHLADLTCALEAGQFVGVVGNVGAGKSSLLNALLGELSVIAGSATLCGVVSYAPQEPWIFEATIRENIVFSEPFDLQRYQSVVEVCELERDLSLMRHGDSTIVGERGSSLSGGQKARIGLARAVYRRADIYLLDDPLAAVDTQVGARLVQRCVRQFLAGSTRLLVTHHVVHLRHADHILLMEGGRCSQQGSYEELKGSAHFQMYAAHEAAGVRLSVLQHSDSVDDGADAISSGSGSGISGSGSVTGVVATIASDEKLPQTKDEGAERLEQQQLGSVKMGTYVKYWRTLNSTLLILIILLLFVLARIALALMDVFVSKWATWEETAPMDNDAAAEFAAARRKVLITYTSLIATTLALYLLRTFGFFAMCLRISLRLHDRLFRGVIRATMHFFYTNASGRILNRFSSDIAKVDVSLPEAMFDSFQFHIEVVAVMIITALSNVWLLLPAIAVICLFYLFRALYIGASRSLKRIEAISRSPLYSHTNQTFDGLTTIRAQHATAAMDREFHEHQNSNTAALFMYISANRAFALWTDLVCVAYIVVVTFSFLVIDRDFYSGDVGLAITQSMSLVIMCQWGMRQTAEMENNMTSVERVLEYAETPPEPPLVTDSAVGLPKQWPNAGRLLFNDVRLRYAEKGDYVLKGLNMQVSPTEKLGIVGRTGAGKSSIVQALFRLAINEGVIDIDGFDTSALGLHDLRSKISIIPQEPVLFTGTLRFNLDPFDERSDATLWQALEDVQLRALVQRLEGGLLCALHDGGSNFSIGQKQLICMARAILRQNKILIMDEPTASVDPDTDKLIQQTVQTNFRDCTVLTIAHRLHTVMDNDRVLVMDAGRIVELGHPHVLLQQKQGHLYRLVQRTGKATAKRLRHIAEESYEKRVGRKKLPPLVE